jgi:hypothetical protein
MKKIVFPLLFVICVPLFLAACFNGLHGDKASIILNLGGSTGNRTVWFHDDDSDILNEIVYTVKISGQDNKELYSTGGTTITATVTPGVYNIDIEARYLDRPYAKGFVENITIKAGKNNVPVSLKEWLDPKKTYLIAEGRRIKKEFDSFTDPDTDDFKDSFTSAFEEAMKMELEVFTISVSDGEHFIKDDNGVNINDGVIVTIKSHGSGEAYLKHEHEDPDYPVPLGSLFSVSSSSELTLQGNIILEGGDSYSPLIVVSGKLTLDGNVTITGNINSETGGGGVYVDEYGTFEMKAGIISGNTTTAGFLGNGGGVYVNKNGEFIMYDGIIKKNEAAVCGGGVYVSEGGTFKMYGGKITLNTATEAGSGVYAGGYFSPRGDVSENVSDDVYDVEEDE